MNQQHSGENKNTAFQDEESLRQCMGRLESLILRCSDCEAVLNALKNLKERCDEMKVSFKEFKTEDIKEESPLITLLCKSPLSSDDKEKVMRELLWAGCDPNAKRLKETGFNLQKTDTSVLHLIARDGTCAMLQDVIAAGANLKEVDEFNYDVLTFSVSSGSLEKIQFLIEGGFGFTDNHKPDSLKSEEEKCIFNHNRIKSDLERALEQAHYSYKPTIIEYLEQVIVSINEKVEMAILLNPSNKNKPEPSVFKRSKAI